MSPMTVILDKDVTLVDTLATQEAKEKARLNAIQNIGNRQILEIDSEAFQEDLENLKFLVKITREEISYRKPHEDPINSKISLKTQDYLISLDESKYESLKLLIPEVSDKQVSENSNKIQEYNPALEEINKLINIEKKYFFQEINRLRQQEARAKTEKELLGKSFFETIVRVDSEAVFIKAFEVQKKLLDLGVVPGLPQEKIKENIKILYPDLNLIDLLLVQKLIDRSTFPNIKIDWRRIDEIEKEAMDSVPNVIITLEKGYILAQKGKDIEAKNYYYLKELNMLHPKADWKQIRKNLYTIIAIIIAFGIYSKLFRPKKFSLQEIMMLLLINFGISLNMAIISTWGINELALIPLAAASILTTSFSAPFIAAILVTCISYFLITSFDFNFWQTLPLYAGSIYGIFLVRKAHQREDLARAGIHVALCQIAVFVLTVLLAVEEFKVSTVLAIAAMYGLGGLISGFISLATLPYLEATLGLLTPFKLTELSNPNQALLKKLKTEAPGTYEHSLNVTRLSEEAGSALGLNTDLMRVGLLYHDIGKTYDPEYFIENNMGKPNPHNTLADPIKSAKIIIAHVPEGIKLAKKYNLPQSIIDFIPMHQGSTITNYFYYKALEKSGKENINADDFRYPGPKPNSKETGIAMMADSVEAALKSIKDLADEAKAKEMIDRIINARLEEGELSETGLNAEDLKTIADCFLKVWRSQNHERIKYPEKTENT